MTNDELGLDPASEPEAPTAGCCGGMADWRRMFERCMPGAAHAEADEAPAAKADEAPAAEAACSCEQGVRL